MAMIGDVLVYTPESAMLMAKGTAAGQWGHVALVTSALCPVGEDVVQASHTPFQGCQHFALQTIESKRGEEGLLRLWNLMCVQTSGELAVVADTAGIAGADTKWEPTVPTKVQLWTAPERLRHCCPEALGENVVQHLMISQGCWSLAAGLYAWWTSSRTETRAAWDRNSFDAIVKAWTELPICSSVPVKFWQMVILSTAHDSLLEEFFPYPATYYLPINLGEHMSATGWVLKQDVVVGGASPRDLMRHWLRTVGQAALEAEARRVQPVTYLSNGTQVSIHKVKKRIPGGVRVTLNLCCSNGQWHHIENERLQPANSVPMPNGGFRSTNANRYTVYGPSVSMAPSARFFRAAPY